MLCREKMGLSKTDFIRGMQCPKMLWLDAHKPKLKRISDETELRLFHGNEFGEKAKAMFGPYTDVTAYIPNTIYHDKKRMIQNTRHAMKKGDENICEASFDYNGYFCAVDILHRLEDDLWELYEVKNVPEVGPEHIQDASYQAWVLGKCGVKLDGVYVVYHYDDEDDPYEPVDITEDAIEYAKIIEANSDRLLKVKNSKDEIMVPCGEQCKLPYECWYQEYCNKLM